MWCKSFGFVINKGLRPSAAALPPLSRTAATAHRASGGSAGLASKGCAPAGRASASRSSATAVQGRGRRRRRRGHFLSIIKKRDSPDRLSRICGVPGMARFLRVKVPPRVATAKCSEPQAVDGNVNGGGSGVAKPTSLRTETGYKAKRRVRLLHKPKPKR